MVGRTVVHIIIRNEIGKEEVENCNNSMDSFCGTNIFGISGANLDAGVIRRKTN